MKGGERGVKQPPIETNDFSSQHSLRRVFQPQKKRRETPTNGGKGRDEGASQEEMKARKRLR